MPVTWIDKLVLALEVDLGGRSMLGVYEYTRGRGVPVSLVMAAADRQLFGGWRGP